MNPLDYYKILIAWCVEDFLTKGIRHCQVFVKNSQSLTDNLVVKFTATGLREVVDGNNLYSKREDAINFVEEQRAYEVGLLNNQVQALIKQIEEVEDRYNSVQIEEEI